MWFLIRVLISFVEFYSHICYNKSGDNMRIKGRDIDKEIRIEGLLIRAVSPLGNENVQRFVSPISNTVLSLLPLKGLNCTKMKIKREDGSSFRVCVMRGKKTQGKTVGILWLHGGGYVLGSPEMAVMSFPKHLINNCNCVIVAPDYTLSAKAPYPAALNDAYQTLLWMKNNKNSLGIDYDKFVVGGESAGGGLTAALCLYARDNSNDSIAFQMPLYPMLDDRITQSSENNNAPIWDTSANKSAWHIYLGDRYMNNYVPVYAAPARETNYKNLPPAISVVGTIEPFYDEVITYFDNIEYEKIETKLMIADGCYHAFDMMAPYAQISKKANAFLLDSYNEFAHKYLI